MRLLLKALTKLLGRPDHTDRAWANFDCPFCGGRRKFGIHVGSMRTKCFKCHSHPPLVRLWKLLGETMPAMLGAELRRRPIKASPLASSRDDFETVPLDGWERLPHGRMDPFERQAFDYARERGADPDLWEFGTIDDEHTMGRVVFLMRDCGLAVSYQARDVLGHGWPKTVNPPHGVGTPKSQLLFGAEHVRPGELLVVVEGVFDAVSVSNAGFRAVGLLGKEASREQLALLRAHDGPIVLMLDRGTGREMSKIGRPLLDQGHELGVVSWRDVAGDDPGELTRREVARMVKGVSWVGSSSALLRATVREIASRPDTPLRGTVRPRERRSSSSALHAGRKPR